MNNFQTDNDKIFKKYNKKKIDTTNFNSVDIISTPMNHRNEFKLRDSISNIFNDKVN